MSEYSALVDIWKIFNTRSVGQKGVSLPRRIVMVQLHICVTNEREHFHQLRCSKTLPASHAKLPSKSSGEGNIWNGHDIIRFDCEGFLSSPSLFMQSMIISVIICENCAIGASVLSQQMNFASVKQLPLDYNFFSETNFDMLRTFLCSFKDSSVNIYYFWDRNK